MEPVAVPLVRAIQALEAQAVEDAALAEAVLFLADATGPRDPFVDPGGGVRAAARSVNERRQRERRHAPSAEALDTAEVVALIDSIHDRRGVDRRRRRGQLLGWRVGARTLHPRWQFDLRRAETRSGLSSVLTALKEVTVDEHEAAMLMVASREDLGGQSLADLFAAGHIGLVVRLVVAAGDQS